MITLMLAGKPLPPILTANVSAALSILVDGQVPLQSVWSVWATVEIASGTTPVISFTPVDPVTTLIDVFVVKGDGSAQHQSFFVQVVSTPIGPITTSINWSKIQYRKSDPIDAQIVFSDPRGRNYQSLTWNLYRNSIWQASGTTATIHYENADHGVYRIVAKVIDNDNNTVTGDSSTVVVGDYEIQASLQPQPGKTMQFLGYAYTGEQIGEASFSSTVAMPMTAMAEQIYLLPGTTYFQVELDPETVRAPGQVVVRTPTGNWSVRGEAPGTIDLPYEFLSNTYFVPAPADLRLQITTEGFATSVGPQLPFRFRIRVKCFYDKTQVYEFRLCPESTSEGGAGQRARRFAVLFSKVNLLTDTDTPEGRMGSSPTAIQTYETDLPETLPVTLSLEGRPDISEQSHRLFYTDQNWTTSYDPATEGLLEVDAHSTYAIEESRPFTISFMMPAYPTIIQRPRRVWGKVAIYLANGYVNAGTVISVNLLTAGGYSTRSVAVPVMADAFSPDLQTYLKIAEANVDISDAEFIDNGIVGIVNLDESGADLVSWPVGVTRPDPAELQGTVYSMVSGPFARFDGACYHNVGPLVAMMGTTTASANGTYTVDASGTIYPLVADIIACYDPKCVPAGLFCYGEYNGATKLHVLQPLYNPAPYVAPADQVTRCYCNPCITLEWVGTDGILPAYDPFVAYTNGSYCGVAYAFLACNGTSNPLVIPYPSTTIPPGYVAYNGTCYGNAGSLAYTTGYSLVGRDEVDVVYDCQDSFCTGSATGGMVVRYRDHETQRDVDVYMNHMDTGVPFQGVVPQTYDDGAAGLIEGHATVIVSKNVVEQPVLVVPGSGTLEFIVSVSSNDKQLIRYRAGVPTRFPMRLGTFVTKMDVRAGDQINFRMYAKRATIHISWKPWVPRPRLYATGTLYPTAPTPIRAVGFTGLTNRSEYAFYGTLPADVSMTEVNPDSILTVKASGVEYALVRARGITDSVPALPFPCVWYGSNTPLVGPLVFKLYSGREDAGGNGDLDVWLAEQGELAPIFAANSYQSLVRYGDPLPTNRVPEVERNSLRVVDSAFTYRWPSAYIANNGNRLVVAAPPIPNRPVALVYADLYTWAGTVPGGAYNILPWNIGSRMSVNDHIYVDMLVMPDGTRMFVAVVNLINSSTFVTSPGGSRDTVRQTTLDFAASVGADLAFNGNFFLPFPSASPNAADVGFVASSGIVFSPFEPQPIGIGYANQSYAILPYAPALNIGVSGMATVVHRDGAYVDNKHVLEGVALWNGVAGSAQVVTNGVKTIPIYGSGTNQLTAMSGYSNSNSWYNLKRARTVVGVKSDRSTLVVCVAEGVSGSLGGNGGMAVGDIVDILMRNYAVYNALNLDGGGSSSLVVKMNGNYTMLNTSLDGPLGRAVGCNLAISIP